jgi:hypothetical protein
VSDLVSQTGSAQQLMPGERVLHVMYAGVSHDLPFAVLDIGDMSTDEQVKQAFANHVDIPVTKLLGYQVDRQENGNLTLRPQASFGRRPRLRRGNAYWQTCAKPIR